MATARGDAGANPGRCPGGADGRHVLNEHTVREVDREAAAGRPSPGLPGRWYEGHCARCRRPGTWFLADADVIWLDGPTPAGGA